MENKEIGQNFVREKRINKLKELRKFQPRSRKKILDSKDVKDYLENFQKDFVFVPTDKASNNISISMQGILHSNVVKRNRIF